MKFPHFYQGFLRKKTQKKTGEFGYLLFRTTKTPPIFNIARICQIANANLHDFAHAVRKESNFSLQMPTVVKATSPTSCDPPRVTMKLAKKLSSKYGGREVSFRGLEGCWTRVFFINYLILLCLFSKGNNQQSSWILGSLGWWVDAPKKISQKRGAISWNAGRSGEKFPMFQRGLT